MTGAFGDGRAETKLFIKTSGDRPYGVAFSHSGVMYIVTAPPTGAGLLSKVTPDGRITSLRPVEGTFIGPGIVVDTSDRIYIATGDKVIVVTAERDIQVMADGFSRCIALDLDKENNLYVADDAAGTIYRISAGSAKRELYRSKDQGNFFLTGLAIDRERGKLFARLGRKVVKFAIESDGSLSGPATIAEDTKAFGLCVGTDGGLYSAALSDVLKIGSDARVEKLSDAPLDEAVGLAQGGNGFRSDALYVTVRTGVALVPRRWETPDGK
jgi:hypothetical protein